MNRGPLPLIPFVGNNAPHPGQCCAKCKFFTIILPPQEAARMGAQPMTLCRRYPPQLQLAAVPAPMPKGVLPKPGDPMPMGFQNQCSFPPVAPEAWCGEYEYDPKKD